jgi:hypothetical protein
VVPLAWPFLGLSEVVHAANDAVATRANYRITLDMYAGNLDCACQGAR